MTIHHKYLAALAATLVLSGGLIAYAASRPTPNPPGAQLASPMPTPSAAVSPTPVVPADRPVAHASQPTGRLEGRRLYPAGELPADFTTCAINLATAQASCIGGNQPTYQLTVAPGTYQVYAVVPSFDPTYQAYFSRFITCGMRASCTDHTPLSVTVPAGGVASGIDVGDFYR